MLYRLFELRATVMRNAALALMVAVLLLNALWSYFFFRKRNLWLAFILGLPYSAIALAVFFLLLRNDSTAALWWLPYVAYLFYAGTFGYRVWRLNRAEREN